MAMDSDARAEFVNGFTKTLITAWSSEAYASKLSTEPRAALAESGLSVPADAEVVVKRTTPGDYEGGLQEQIDLWEAGLATGRYEFHVPLTPQIDTAELSEGDLADVAAGGTSCCCPCSCCT